MAQIYEDILQKERGGKFEKKICQTAVLFGMAAVLFCRAADGTVKDDRRESLLGNETVSDSEGTAETEWQQWETQEAMEQDTETETAEWEMSEEEEDELNLHYGNYRIAEFLPTIYYSAQNRDEMPKQTADMLLGQMVVIQPEIFSVYDTKRWPHSENNNFPFFFNYIIEKYVEEKPSYIWTEIDDLEGEMKLRLKPDDAMKGAVGDYKYRLEGVVIVQVLSSADGTKPYMSDYYFYTVREDADRLIMYSGRTMQYFLLERYGEESVPEEPLKEWSERESRELRQGIYGEYRISEFLPTKFFPVWDGEIYGEKCDILPAEEAALMIGQDITVSEDMFTTYDNYRLPTSSGSRRLVDDFWIKKIEIGQPDYRIRTVSRDEIYGIRDGMLPENLEQQEYVEIDVYPGYEINDGCEYLPQMYLAGDGKIFLLAMGEYFLLERTGSLKEGAREPSGNQPDLSGWSGTYVFSEESGEVKTDKWVKNDNNDSYHPVEVSRNYRIEVMENDGGGYYAVITIQEEGIGDIKVLADVCGSRETVSFVFKEYLSGELTGFERHSDVLLSIRKDENTGELTTHWGGLNFGREPGNHFIKE